LLVPLRELLPLPPDLPVSGRVDSVDLGEEGEKEVFVGEKRRIRGGESEGRRRGAVGRGRGRALEREGVRGDEDVTTGVEGGGEC
jgi:hypothetical protein